MKTIINGTLIVGLLVLSIPSFANFSEWEYYVNEARTQIEKFMNQNNKYLHEGEFDKVNYTYVYKPGEKFDFYRPIPESFKSKSVSIIDNEWFYDPGDLLPDITLFNETLVHYNTTPYHDNAYRQQFIVIIDILDDPYFLNLITKSIPTTSIPGFPASIKTRLESDDSQYKEKIDEFYEYFINSINNENLFKIDYPQGEWGEESMTVLLIAFASLEKTNLLLSKEPTDETISLEINLKITQFWNTITGVDLKNPLILVQNNPNFKDYKNITNINYPDNPLAIVAQIIQTNLEKMWKYKPEEITSCDQFLFMLTSSEARTYYNLYCDNEDFDQSYLEEFRKCAKAFDIVVFDYKNRSTNVSGDVSATFVTLDDVKNYIHQKLTEYISSNPTTSFEYFLLDYYDSENFPQSEKDDFVVKTLYSCFFNINLDKIEDLESNLRAVIIDLTSGWLSTPAIDNPEMISKPYNRELRWHHFNKIIKNVVSLDIYEDSDRLKILNVLKENEIGIWEKVIKTKGEGFGIVGITAEEIVQNLENLVFSVSVDPLSVNENDNILIYEMSKSYYSYKPHPNEEISYVTNKELKTIFGSHVSFMESSDEDQKAFFTFTTKFCPLERTTYTTGTGAASFTSCIEPEVEHSIQNISFFDLVYPIKISYPLYAEDCCFGELDNPCEFKTKPIPAFSLASKIYENKLNLQLDIINVALSLTGVYGAIKGTLAAQTHLARAVGGVYFASNTATLIADAAELENNYGDPLGPPNSLSRNKVFNTIVKIANVIDMLSNFQNIQDFDNWVSKINTEETPLLNSNDLKDAGVGERLLSNVKESGLGASDNSEDIDRYIEVLAKFSEDGKTGNPAVINTIDIEEAEFYNLPMGLSVQDKSKAYKFLIHNLYLIGKTDPDIIEKANGIADFLEQQGHLEKFVDAMAESSETLNNFFKNTTSAAQMEKKIKIWSRIEDAYPNIPHCIN